MKIAKEINVVCDKGEKGFQLRIGGFLDKKNTYLRFELNTEGSYCVGTIGNNRLYRLAKNIVKQFEIGE
jgi:hypothetical protein